jgi:tRNA (cytidine/uridine-2'-O-)-methyltransferase
MHVIHPTGFPFSRRALKRGGLDYVEHADFVEHDDFTAFEGWRAAAGRRLVLLTTKARESLYASELTASDVLMVGRESAGVPEAVAARAGLRIRIPMRDGLRSLNVATAASLALGEALRQTGAFTALA